jgi:hypothetical protein
MAMKQTLSTMIGNHFLTNKSIINLMTEFILALIKIRDVNLTGIALVICGDSEVSSGYRRLQRFFAKAEICYICLAKLIVAIARIEGNKWTLAIDRTNWKFGKLHINILVLSVHHHGIGIPILWSMLDNNGGNSNSGQRQDLLDKFIRIFGVDKIGSLLADREFIGDVWFKYLADIGIKFYIRIGANITIGRAKNELITANKKVARLKNDEYIILDGERYLGLKHNGPKVKIAAAKNEEGELMVIATNDEVQHAIDKYRERWSIETLFGCLKTRGFNFENTHMVYFDRIGKLLALLAITFTLCHVLGIWRNSIKPIKLKQHKRKSVSLFRYGLDYLRKLLLNSKKVEETFMEIIEMLMMPAQHYFKRLIVC